ncbi:MAG: tyrosine-type recombinase/integrase [Eubacterium sp.]|jgi:integrase/recombinase XerD|nr:tyrosine-type recombinase/integrase [Eubacterium sp.]
MNTGTTSNPLEAYVMHLKDKGYSSFCIESSQNGCSQIRKLQKSMQEKDLNHTVLDAFAVHVDERHKRGEIRKSKKNFYLRIVFQLRLYLDTGKFDLSIKNVPHFEGSQEFCDILAELDKCTLWSAPIQRNLIYASRSLFRWLDSRGLPSIQDISTDILRKYLFDKVQKSRTKDIQGLRYNLKLLIKYLIDVKNMKLDDCAALLSLPAPAPKRLLPPAKAEHIVAALNVIDKNTTVGKRDYAIILLAAKTGLRACDICSLKLEDLDWRAGEIRLSQEKTGKSIALPITQDIGNSICDYILNGRKAEEGCRNVFTRTLAPYVGISTKTPNTRYNVYLKAAGINRTSDDGLGFHSLRRFVGTQLISSGSTIETAAQILGHSDILSTEKYLSFDSKNMKTCSLSLSGIEMRGGGLHV